MSEKTLAHNLELIREALRLTNVELAERLGVSESLIRKTIGGRPSGMKLPRALVRHFGIPLTTAVLICESDREHGLSVKDLGEIIDRYASARLSAAQLVARKAKETTSVTKAG